MAVAKRARKVRAIRLRGQSTHVKESKVRIDKNAIVYFVNEEYGVVIRHDRYERQWCPAHATKSLATAEKAARLLLPCLPGVDGMAIAREAKLRALRPEIRTTSADALIKKINARWREREAKYAAL